MHADSLDFICPDWSYLWFWISIVRLHTPQGEWNFIGSALNIQKFNTNVSSQFMKFAIAKVQSRQP